MITSGWGQAAGVNKWRALTQRLITAARPFLHFQLLPPLGKEPLLMIQKQSAIVNGKLTECNKMQNWTWSKKATANIKWQPTQGGKVSNTNDCARSSKMQLLFWCGVNVPSNKFWVLESWDCRAFKCIFSMVVEPIWSAFIPKLTKEQNINHDCTTSHNQSSRCAPYSKRKCDVHRSGSDGCPWLGHHALCWCDESSDKSLAALF